MPLKCLCPTHALAWGWRQVESMPRSKILSPQSFSCPLCSTFHPTSPTLSHQNAHAWSRNDRRVRAQRLTAKHCAWSSTTPAPHPPKEPGLLINNMYKILAHKDEPKKLQLSWSPNMIKALRPWAQSLVGYWSFQTPFLFYND